MSTKREVSPEFWMAFCDSGSIVADCRCGRTCFEDDARAGDFEPGELDRLRERASSEPDKCIAMNSVSISSLGFIEGCPCNGAAPYETFLIEYEKEILSYIGGRIAESVETSTRREQILALVKKNVAERVFRKT